MKLFPLLFSLSVFVCLQCPIARAHNFTQPPEGGTTSTRPQAPLESSQDGLNSIFEASLNDEGSLSTIIGYLTSSDYELRKRAASSLCRVKGEGETTEKVLEALLENIKWAARYAFHDRAEFSLKCIEELSATYPRIAPALIEALKKFNAQEEPDWKEYDEHGLFVEKYQLPLMRGLGNIGPKASEAIPDIVDGMKFVPSRQWVTAIHVLAKFGPKALPVLRKMLKDEPSDYRKRVLIEALNYTPRVRKKVLTEMIALLDDPLWRVRDAASEAIVKSGRRAIPELLKEINSESIQVRVAVALTLKKLGAKNSDASLKALSNLLQDREFSVHEAAVEAFISLGPKARQFLPDLESLNLETLGYNPSSSLVLLKQSTN